MHSRRRTDEPTPHVTLQVGVVQGPHMEQSLELHATVSSSVPRHPPKPAVPPNTYYSIIVVSFDKTFYVGCSRNCIFICQVALTRRQKKDFSIFESSCHLPTCLSHLVEASRCPFLFLNVKHRSPEYQLLFFCVKFDPTWNQTQVHRFSSKRSIDSINDRFKFDESFWLAAWNVRPMIENQIYVIGATNLHWKKINASRKTWKMVNN